MKNGTAILVAVLGCLQGPAADAYNLSSKSWPAPQTTFYVNISGGGGSWNTAFAGAMAQWTSDTVFTYLIVNGQSKDPCHNPSSGGAFNGVKFASTACGDAWGSGVLAVAMNWSSGSNLTQAGVVFNNNEDWDVYTGPLQFSVADVRRVAVHELGHALGLNHEDNAPAIMGTYISDIETPTADDIAGVSAKYGPDTTPNTFNFVDQTNVALSTVTTSAPITITGIAAPAPIGVAGGTYSIGCGGTFTGAAGTISNNQTVCVRHTSSATGATATNTTLAVGGVPDTFTSTTVAADTTPNAYSFVDQANVATSTVITSAMITITGINTAVPISVTGGSYSIGCGVTFTTLAWTISNNQTVCVRHTSSAAPATATNTTLTVGGVGDTFTSTTVAADTTPNAFSFVDQTNVVTSSVITSTPVTISGINAAAPISVVGGTYSIGCGATFTAVAGTISNSQTVCVRHTSSAAAATVTSTTLTVGGVADTFTSTTVAADTTPNAFSFVDQTNVATSTVITSTAVTISGINAAAAISVVGGTFSIGCGATFTAVAGTISNSESVCVRHSSAATDGTATSTSLTVGGVADTFTSTTASADSDIDDDGVLDVSDNCKLVANPTQLDADQDGYGNICDGDLNNTGLVTATDLTLLRNVLNQPASASPTAAAADLNGSGLVTTTDDTLLRNRLNSPAGPSGYSCAGTMPCP